MGKITFIATYPEMAREIESTFSEQDSRNWELDIMMVFGLQGVRAMVQKNIQSDVVIARGLAHSVIKRKMPNIPIVDLPISGYDTIKAIYEACEKFNAKKVAVVGTRDMIYGADSIARYLGIGIVTVDVDAEDDTERAIREELADQGIDVIIGGLTATEVGTRYGYKTVCIQSGREAIYRSLIEAKRVATVLRQEQERNGQFRTILEYAAEGIIAVDGSGNINLVNKMALNLTRLDEMVLGKPIEAVLPEVGLVTVIRSGQAEIGEVRTINGQQLAINKVPILIKEQIAGAVATFQKVTAIQELEGKIRQKLHRKGHIAKVKFENILGNSQAIRNVIQVAEQFSQVGSNVLILGESGTGKEMFAQSIHNNSDRSKGPFVAVNCAALPENLLESELFGYAEGAFTGASRGGKMGLFEMAHGGTIFLDEISEISPVVQSRLLRVLQEREIMRIGDNRVIPIDVRIIAAANKDLEEAIRKGAFRSDLYFRLDVLTLRIPPLRERREDILPLLNSFMTRYSIRFKKPQKKLTPGAQKLLMEYTWPGNVRQLQNIAERITVLNVTNGDTIDEVALQTVVSVPRESFFSKCDNKNDVPKGFTQRRQAAQLEMIERVLKETNFDYEKTAQSLCISRSTLWRRLKSGKNDNEII